jgi:hypothetical protein
VLATKPAIKYGGVGGNSRVAHDKNRLSFSAFLYVATLLSPPTPLLQLFTHPTPRVPRKLTTTAGFALRAGTRYMSVCEC